MLVINISNDILVITYKNKLHVQVSDVVSKIQIGAYLAFIQKPLGQHVTLGKQGSSNNSCNTNKIHYSTIYAYNFA